MDAKGHNGQVNFDGHCVTIVRSGLLARASIGKGQKRIPIGSVTSVQWKPAGALMNGFIQFGVLGGTEVRSRAGRQTKQAAYDENSVIFTRKQMPAFERMRAAIEAGMARRDAANGAAPAVSVADELTKLGHLVRQGVLSREEFERQKVRLLTG